MLTKEERKVGRRAVIGFMWEQMCQRGYPLHIRFNKRCEEVQVPTYLYLDPSDHVEVLLKRNSFTRWRFTDNGIEMELSFLRGGRIYLPFDAIVAINDVVLLDKGHRSYPAAVRAVRGQHTLTERIAVAFSAFLAFFLTGY